MKYKCENTGCDYWSFLKKDFFKKTVMKNKVLICPKCGYYNGVGIFNKK